MPKGPFAKRLPLLILAAVGIWLYQSGLFTTDRTLIWQTGPNRDEIRKVELQVWDTDGELLKRTQLDFPTGAPADIVQELSLGRGRYDARFVVDRAKGPQETGARSLVVTTDETYWLSLGRR